MKTFLVLILTIYSTKAASVQNLGKKDVPAGSARFIVSIQKSVTNGYEHLCGGSIINENWIVTAAHCVPKSKAIARQLVIFAGCINVASPEKECIRRTISAFRSHRLYNGNTDPFDIALIKVNQPYSFSASLAKIELPQENIVPNGDGTLYGWGSISGTNDKLFPNILQQVDLPIISMTLCKDTISKHPEKDHLNLHDSNTCTGPLTGGKGICHSDSGGPFVKNIGGKSTLIGVASWGGVPCGKIDTPSVFTRVSYFIEWIKEGVEQHKDVTFI